MPSFTDHVGREWQFAPFTVASLSAIREAGGVDLWAVVQGNGSVDADLPRLAATFKLVCRDSFKIHGVLSKLAIDACVDEVMSDGDSIIAFRHAVETEITRFFPSATRGIWASLVESRSPTSILKLMPTNSADSSAPTPAA